MPIPVVALAPILALTEQILKVIANHQQLILSAPPELRDRYLQRLDRWESFWDRLADPIYKLVEREANAGQKETN